MHIEFHYPKLKRQLRPKNLTIWYFGHVHLKPYPQFRSSTSYRPRDFSRKWISVVKRRLLSNKNLPIGSIALTTVMWARYRSTPHYGCIALGRWKADFQPFSERLSGENIVHAVRVIKKNLWFESLYWMAQWHVKYRKYLTCQRSEYHCTIYNVLQCI